MGEWALCVCVCGGGGGGPLTGRFGGRIRIERSGGRHGDLIEESGCGCLRVGERMGEDCRVRRSEA